MKKTTFIVLNENTFGYTEDSLDKDFLRMSVLGISVIDGGEQYHLNNIILAQKKNIRIATSADFEKFRVSEIGFKENPECVYHRLEFVNLGLPSGKKWASVNVEGYFTFDDAVKFFGEALPTREDFKELIDNCKSEWDDVRKGRVFTGPNGNSIFLPAMGYKHHYGPAVDDRGSDGYYWSSSIYDEDVAYYLYFDSDGVYTDRPAWRSYGFSVRLVRKK